MSQNNRDDFDADVKIALAKRASYFCSMCRAVTVGPSQEHELASTNVGVAAHISAAAPGGRRYDSTLTKGQRKSIGNGIWLCQTHAKLIDDDEVTWTTSKLLDLKNKHELFMSRVVGIPQVLWKTIDIGNVSVDASVVTPREYAFVSVADLDSGYKSFLTPMLKDRHLGDDAMLGALMCTAPGSLGGIGESGAEWTVFVEHEWLRWYVDGEKSGFRAVLEVPPQRIWGQVPGWPDKFYEFLTAITRTNTTFSWHRHPRGYMVLSQNA
jgi:hypothetical protein